jgi:cyclopropane-fatty-acyl-phospholipid synthase
MDTATVAVSPARRAARVAAADFLDALFPAPRRFAIRLWEGTTLPAAGEPAVTLAITRPSLRRMFRPPVELSLGEAYLRGEVELEGDVAAAAEIAESAARAVRGPGDVLRLARLYLSLPADEGPPAQVVGVAAARLEGKDRRREADVAGMRHHYDVGNDF